MKESGGRGRGGKGETNAVVCCIAIWREFRSFLVMDLIQCRSVCE